MTKMTKSDIENFLKIDNSDYTDLQKFEQIIEFWNVVYDENSNVLGGLNYIQNNYTYYTNYLKKDFDPTLNNSFEEYVFASTFKNSLDYIKSWSINTFESILKNDNISDSELHNHLLKVFYEYIKFRSNKLIKSILESSVSFNSTSLMSNMKEMYVENANKKLYINIFNPLLMTIEDDCIFDSSISLYKRFKY